VRTPCQPADIARKNFFYHEVGLRVLWKNPRKKNMNVLQHIMGYFKQQLTADEKQELLEVLDQYRREYVPLIVPITLLNHYVRKYGQPYLNQQVYLNPHPLALKLRNHA
jgi:uncharacterized protein YbgA (DUF1722 family)